MRFAQPVWLFLIWAAPVALALYAWGHRRRAGALRRYAPPETLARIAAGRSSARRWVLAGLTSAALLFLALALSGPLYGFRWRTTERKGVDLIVAVDCSRSMLAEDLRPNRMARAKREVVDLLNRSEGDRIGLVAFAGTAFLQCPLTLDYAGLHIFLRALSPEFLPVGGTALADAIDTARKSFDPESPADRAVVLLTDGEETTGGALGAAERAREAGIRIFVVGIGSAEGAPIPQKEGGFVKDPSGNIVLARIGEESLQRLASLTGGTYVRSTPGDEDLDAIYREIRGQMEAETLEARKIQVWEDRYQWPLALAVLALLAELALPLGRRGPAGLAIVVLLLGPAVAGLKPAQAASASGLVRQGLGRYEAGDYDGAREAFVQAQLEEPDAPEIAFDLGNAYYRTGDYENAVASYSAALEDASDDLKARVLYNRGNAAYRMGRLPEALKDYEAALQVDPTDHDAKLNQAFVKRLLEQQKQESPPHEGDEEDEPEGSEEQEPEPQASSSNEGSEGAQSQASSPQGQEKKDPGDQEPAAQPQAPEENSQAGSARAPEKEREEEGSGVDAAGSTPTREPDEAERRRAEALLNRLKDQPGKAMIPAYGKRQIEKDW